MYSIVDYFDDVLISWLNDFVEEAADVLKIMPILSRTGLCTGTDTSPSS